jgi:minor histocompatibility antigen H13
MDEALSYVSMLFIATALVYYGSFLSLNTKPSKEESVQKNDIAVIPIVLSISLTIMYIIITYFDRQYFDYFMNAYFFIGGFFAIYEFLHRRNKRLNFGLVLKKDGVSLVDFKFNYISVLCGLLSFTISIYYFYTKNWLSANFIAMCLSLTALELMKYDSFVTGMGLLSALFFYDILMVFGTEMMVTVAKGLDLPMKILLPRGDSFMMLGLGDIVIPGCFVALCLKFDFHLYKSQNIDGKIEDDFGKPYFYSSLVSYVLGLIITFGFLLVFKVGQPALLYLVPCCILSVLICAFVRKELKLLYEFQIETEEPIIISEDPTVELIGSKKLTESKKELNVESVLTKVENTRMKLRNTK